MMDQFKVSTFSISKRQRSIIACLNCRKKHSRCIIEYGKESCNNCLHKDLHCVWDSSVKPGNYKKSKKLISIEKEKVYQQLFLDNNYTNQFVCATQPLASLLSKDSFLCFDGDNFGLYYPWRGVNNTGASENNSIDVDLKNYLDLKGAFIVPPVNEQRRLFKFYLDKLYPLYPVVERKLLEDIKSIPLLLLNSILLVTIRFDSQLPKDKIRSRANELYERCKLLELTEKNKITLIQSYLLLSYHEEGMDGSNSSMEFIARACNLCGELAITNMGGSNGISKNQEIEFENDVFKKIPYHRGFLLRLFWVSFCCDRLISATSGREMFYNTADMMVEPPSISDFDDGEFQKSDFETFTSYLSICHLVERVQGACYRPPKNRTIDDWSLEEDLVNWSINSLQDSRSDFQNFLKIAHAYTCILYFRCYIDTISLITRDISLSNDRESKAKSLQYIDKYSKDIVDCIESTSYIQHIVVVHAILHVIALVQVEIKTSVVSPLDSESHYQIMARRSLSILDELRHFWWFAGSSFHLCKEVMQNNIHL